MISSALLSILLAVSAAAAGVLAVLAVSLRKKCLALGRRVEQSAHDLESLQRAFAHFAMEMSAAVASHHGHVTRVMGDGIMSVFCALEPNPWHVQDAIAATLAMQGALEHYNRRLADRELPQLRFGIGIHCGDVVAGPVGSDKLVEFTVMGDTVNVASRVEALTRRLGPDILVTSEVRSRLGDRFCITEMPATPIKGKRTPS